MGISNPAACDPRGASVRHRPREAEIPVETPRIAAGICAAPNSVFRIQNASANHAQASRRRRATRQNPKKSRDLPRRRYVAGRVGPTGIIGRVEEPEGIFLAPPERAKTTPIGAIE